MTYTHEDITRYVLGYLDATGMKPTAFGKKVAGDGNLVANIVNGRDLRLSTVSKIHNFIKSNPPPNGAP